MFHRLLQNRTPAPSVLAQRVSFALKVCLLFFPVGFFLWFLSEYFVLSGTYIAETDFCRKSDDISPLLPWDEVGEVEIEESCIQPLYGSLMTFDVKAPRWFEKAKLELEFDPKDQPVMDLGLRRRDLITVDTRPVFASLLEDPAWQVSEKDGIKFFQKEKTYTDLLDFLEDPQALRTKSIGTFHYSLPIPDLLPNYQPRPDHRIVINKTLRGSHRFSVYLKDEPLDLTITKQDLNAYAGRDPLLIKISLYDQPVDTMVIEDDGVELGGGTMKGPLQVSTIFKEGLPEGPYQIELMSNDDVLIRSIDSGHHLLVFHDRLFLADNLEYLPNLDVATQPTTLMTNASTLLFSTSHPNGFQTMTIGDRAYALDRVNDFVRVDGLRGSSMVAIPKNDVVVEGRGVYAFHSDQWFLPVPENVLPLSVDSTPTYGTIDYAVARYPLPERVGRNLRSTHTFDLKPYLSDDYQFRVMMMFPGIDERKGRVNLNRIRVTLTKPPVTFQNAWERARNVFRRSF